MKALKNFGISSYGNIELGFDEKQMRSDINRIGFTCDCSGTDCKNCDCDCGSDWNNCNDCDCSSHPGA